MGKGINKVIIIGNLGQDPETRSFPDGGAITNISIATSESWKDKQTGQKQEKTEWHKIVFFDRLAEIAGEYLKKGSKVYIEGKIVTQKWQDQQGNDRYSTSIHASQMQMLDGVSKNGVPQQESHGGYTPKENAKPQQAVQAPQQAMDNSFDDSDIPF